MGLRIFKVVLHENSSNCFAIIATNIYYRNPTFLNTYLVGKFSEKECISLQKLDNTRKILKPITD